MKFALRDDDLNFFFSPDILEKNFKGIWEICPVSMSIVPFMKGNWLKNVNEAEVRGPGPIEKSILDSIISDNTIYPIGNNLELITYIKNKIFTGKIYLTIHAIYHRNEDAVIPQFKSNFGIGAEFYTDRDLTKPLESAINYIEHIFNQHIEVFTPPQNLINSKGFEAIKNNKLAICGDLPSLRKFNTIRILGIKNFIKYSTFKLRNKNISYPYPLISKKIKIIGHQRLQPNTNIERLYSSFEEAYKLNGSFVVSTHSYAFDFKMNNSNNTMGETLKEFIQYVAKKPNIEFVNLGQIFSEK